MKDRQKKANIITIRVFLLSLLIALISTLIYSFLVVSLRFRNPMDAGQHYLVVIPGASITRCGKPSPALRKRLDKAIELRKNNQVEKFYISGTRYEIIAMKNYLEKKGVSTINIISDDKGENTYQTVVNITRYIETNRLSNDLIFVSQRYHLPRIALFARRQGLDQATMVTTEYKGVRAESKSQFLLRETLAYYKALWLNH